MTIRSKFKAFLSRYPQVWSAYQQLKAQFNRIKTSLYFLTDMTTVYRGMHWKIGGNTEVQLTSELLFQFHKIEKGLVLPGPKRFFGEEPARAVIKLLSAWDTNSLPRANPVYLGALETLQAYKSRLIDYSLDKDNKILPLLTDFLQKNPLRAPSLITPQKLQTLSHSSHLPYENFKDLALARRSVRSFDPQQVPVDRIHTALELALLSPSACNRQPCKVYLVQDESKKKELLALQNGNRGFGHLIPTLAIIVADTGVFFDASERHEPYIDGGLFSMSFMYALASQGVATCCLNWCVAPENDKQLKRLLGIPANEVVVMLMAVGHPAEETYVPKSPRKETKKQIIEVS